MGASWELQVWLLFGVRFVQTIQRMAMGPLLVFICSSDELGPCTATQKGSLLAAFSLGYVSTQVLGGIVADAVGPRIVICFAILCGSVACFATPEATVMFGGIRGLWAVTVVMGAAQGPLFPTSIAYLAGWLPDTARSYASTMLDSGITLGSLIALPCSGFLAVKFGWQSAFRLYVADERERERDRQTDKQREKMLL